MSRTAHSNDELQTETASDAGERTATGPAASRYQDRFLSVRETAERAAVPIKTARYWCVWGKVKCYRRGQRGNSRILQSSLDKFLAKRAARKTEA